MISLTESDVFLLNRVQRNFPISHDPFAEIAQELGRDKSEVINRLSELKTLGVVSRFGGVINHKKVGKSTLAALKVPQDRIEITAELVNSFEEVNHNYLREHEYNLWFVVTANSQDRIDSLLKEIEERSKFPLISLPMIRGYHIDLAFKI